MPALVHFNRKWLIACDDLVIPFAIETILRIIWLIATIVVTWIEFSGCSDNTSFIECFFYALIGQYIITVCLCIAISITSSRGSVLQTHKRIHLSKFLYVKCATVLIDLALVSFGIWILSQELNICSQWKIFIEAVIVNLSVYVLAVIIGVFICYNVMGSSFYWNTSHGDNSTQIFKKAEKIWQFRLKYFCCCADVSEDEKDLVYIDISSFLSTFLNDVDLAATDILAGLITVCKKHAIEKRKFKWWSRSDAQLASKPKPSWMTVDNALYYLRIAKSTYGWVAFFNPLYPWKLCILLSPSRCCRGLFQSETSTKQGDPFYCDSSAVEKISGLSESDVLYASFSNSIYEPAFIITYDHTKKAVIIAIRGTCSFSDLITVMDADEMTLPLEVSSDKIKCHRGALRSALFIQKKINELKILQVAFSENPSYNLVITGHSLGASIASILGLLLHKEYPSLQCYSYAPLAVLSTNGIEQTFDFVFSIVVGDDVTPRLSTYSLKELQKQVCVSLEETQLPKYKLLTKTFCHCVRKSLELSHEVLTTSEVYENKQMEIKDEIPIQDEVCVDVIPKEDQLYAPGRILYLESSDRYEHSWVTGFYFQNIIISPHIIKDHQPHQIQLLLEKYKCMENAALPLVQESLHIQHI